ncbi:hypothetical protein BDQ12DRAFT_686014 [Crucibulum laeve]|uniref:Homeobox domain-containing protein n=1 Tax=Crucibulum laeve TaxID=68775 RepID=A0A5C3LWW5_9AGAR|nr:hypothetical protein BDQ12DRAFT_686014 [Crucibulum laeve]
MISQVSPGPLHLLATVASSQTHLDYVSDPSSPSSTSDLNDALDHSFSSEISTTSLPRSIIPSSAHISLHSSSPSLANLHIPCGDNSPGAGTNFGPLRRSNSSNYILCAELSSLKPYNTRSLRKKVSPKVVTPKLDSQRRIKKKREELLDKAKKIKSLDNSPVNDRQFLVLRMVYDQITMYPSEAWIVLVAIIINRSFRQVKNWFSNERQKNRVGEVVSIQSEEGDKVRVRSEALKVCAEWSDEFFEAVVMIHNFKILRNFGWQANKSTKSASYI